VADLVARSAFDEKAIVVALSAKVMKSVRIMMVERVRH
jgi:hypothetical protein